MTKPQATGLMVILLIAVATAIGLFSSAKYSEPATSVSSNADDASVRHFVEEFGSKFKNVSLLAPDVNAQLQTQYGPYVSSELLTKWENKTESPPGRQTSSPWPEKIEVVSVTPQGASFIVDANVIEVANGAGGNVAPVAVYPITMQLEKRDASYVITGLIKGPYSELPQQQTITGNWECLPHKDATGPQTLECAFGVARDQSDGHYAVDTSLMATYPVDYPTGTHVRITGIVTPADQLDSIQKYDIDGIIQATTIEKL